MKSDAARSALRALCDSPLEHHEADGLAFAPYADALAGLLDHPDTGTPLTLAINAPWGAGKSTLAHLIKQRLTEKPAPGDSRPHITCWFNAWMHDDAPSLSTAFAAELARAADRERHPLRRILSPLPRALWSRGVRLFFWSSLFATFGLLFIALTLGWEWLSGQWHELRILTSLMTGEALEVPAQGTNTAREAIGVGGLSVLLTAVVGRVPRLLSAAHSVASFLENPQATATLGGIAEVRAQLGAIIQQARRGQRRFVVFVDDLERCHPPRSIDLLEVVSLLLDHPGVVVVIMADMPAVAACADIKYKELAELHSPTGAGDGEPQVGNYGRLYVHKIVQLQFDLPPNTNAQLHDLLARLAEPPEAPARAATEAGPAQGAMVYARAAGHAVLRWLPGAERRRRRELAQIRAQIDALLAAAADGAALEQFCAASRLPIAQARALVRERALQRLMNDATLLREAHAEVAAHLSPYPRSLKRFLNHVRIVASVADARGVLCDGLVTNRHIGRWAALKERWPLTAAAVLRQPARLLELEQHQSPKALGDLLYAWSAEGWDAAEFSEFLRSGTVSLGEVAEQIVRFVHATSEAAERAPTVSLRTGPIETTAPASTAPGARSA